MLQKIMSISPRFLDELRRRLTLSDIIGRRIKVTRAGREFKACCPFHGEKTPSFTINDDKQFYHCFGCGVHGDVIKFVMEHDNLAFMDAIGLLVAEAGMEVPQFSPEEAKKAKVENDLYTLMDEATSFFQAQLQAPVNKDSMKYLLDRGLSMETIAEFRIGFAPDDGQVLRKYLLDKGFAEKDMITAGIVKASTRGTEAYAFFRDRVMFPVPDRRGRIVAFGGRILPEHLRPPRRTDFTPPKYINSTETPLFHKGSMLYGEPTARRAAAEGLDLVVVEGYLDVIACAQSGFRGALAPMGTALTEEQIISCWKMIPQDMKVPILCFDGDNAGQKAAARVVERILPLLQPGCSVRFAFMPDGEDPDSLLKSGGAKALENVLKNTMSLFEFIWKSHISGKDFKTPEMRAAVIKALENDVAKIADKDVQVHYKTLLRQKISGFFFAQPKFEKNFGKKPQGIGLVSSLKRPSAQRKRVFPRVVLATLLNHPHIFEGLEETLASIRFEDMDLVRLHQKTAGILGENYEISRDELLESLKNSGFAQEVGDILNESVYVHASFCSPSAREEDVESKLVAYINDANAAGVEKEIQHGWRRAVQEADAAEEEKFKAMVSMRFSDEEDDRF